MSIAELAARQIAKAQDEREQNRRDFPQHTLFVDRLEAEFGKVRTLYVSEGGKTLGKPCAENWVKW